jgi:hypothetical protein
MLFPFEMWEHYCIGAYWRGNNIYAPIMKNLLSDYLASCFKEPPIIGWFTTRKSKKHE